MEAIFGGAIIGLAVSILLLFNGRVAGISGIIGAAFQRDTPDKNWRVLFILGLLTGGLILRFLKPEALTLITQATTFDFIFAGLLVGFGTLMGNGCTSGHGVCGISRLSLRSIISTMTFIVFGILGVLLFRTIRGDL